MIPRRSAVHTAARTVRPVGGCSGRVAAQRPLSSRVSLGRVECTHRVALQPCHCPSASVQTLSADCSHGCACTTGPVCAVNRSIGRLAIGAGRLSAQRLARGAASALDRAGMEHCSVLGARSAGGWRVHACTPVHEVGLPLRPTGGGRGSTAPSRPRPRAIPAIQSALSLKHPQCLRRLGRRGAASAAGRPTAHGDYRVALRLASPRRPPQGTPPQPASAACGHQCDDPAASLEAARRARARTHCVSHTASSALGSPH